MTRAQSKPPSPSETKSGAIGQAVQPLALRPRTLLARTASNVLRAPLLSPAGLLVRAALIVLVFALVHSLGWREHTTFLSGTPTSAAGGAQQSATLGMIYIALYLAAVLLAPILAIAAVLLAFVNRWFQPGAQVGRATPCAPLEERVDGAHGVTRPTSREV